jgi:restriction endonuclease S subunit
MTGKLPKNWSWVSIEECAEVNPRTHIHETVKEATFLAMKDVSESGRIIGGSTVELASIGNGYTCFQTNDILVAKITPCFENGKGALTHGLVNNIGLGSTEFHVLRTKCSILPTFLHLITTTHRFRATGEFTMSGSAGQKRVPAEFLRSYSIHLPPMHEQARIVEAIFAWDTAIEKTERLIAAKHKRNKALSNLLLFGHARFKQRNTKTTRALHWFSAPSDWQVVEIGKIAREVSALNGSDGDLPVLSCSQYDGLVESLKYFDKQVFSYDTSKYKVVRHSQFAYATNHIEEGSIGYQDLVPAGLVSPIYTVFQADAKMIDDGYLYKLLKTEKLRQIFAANTNASVDRRGSLRWKEFARIHIPLPQLDEQREISAVLDVTKREVVLLQAEVEALKKQKRGLMQKLLTGQWRVNAPTTKE